ncbi:MAG: hypothetical protein CMK59_04975 [Proteobacteria bacterium]|nr:hypothetical protein [Pseudomonadota bacterium]
MGRAQRRRNRRARMRRSSPPPSPANQLPCDLHIHSNSSDGVLTPNGVLRAAVKGGLKVISLTDHDLSSALPFGWNICEQKKIFVVHGSEISVSHEGTELHILVYFPSEAPVEFLQYCDHRVQDRAQRYDRLREWLFEKGIGPLPSAEEKINSGSKALTRLHLAQDVVRCRYASSVSEVFDRWLHEQPYPSYFPDIKEVLSFVENVGGFSSWAHPKTEDAKKWLSLFKTYGLKGVEGFRPTRGRQHRRKLRELAASLQLHVTGGSDTHGSSLGSFSVPAVKFRSWMEPIGIWECLLSNN